jgi:hypothetical protein
MHSANKVIFTLKLICSRILFSKNKKQRTWYFALFIDFKFLTLKENIYNKWFNNTLLELNPDFGFLKDFKNRFTGILNIIEYKT